MKRPKCRIWLLLFTLFRVSQIRRKENNLKFAAHKRTPSEVKEKNRISTIFAAKASYQTRNAWKLAKIRQSALYARNDYNNSARDPLCPCVPKTLSNLWNTAQSRVNNILSKSDAKATGNIGFPKNLLHATLFRVHHAILIKTTKLSGKVYFLKKYEASDLLISMALKEMGGFRGQIHGRV